VIVMLSFDLVQHCSSDSVH